MSAVAGWYTDPSGVPGQLRWWDGSQWTDHVTPDPDLLPVEEAEATPEVAPEPTPAEEPTLEQTSAATAEPTPEPAGAATGNVGASTSGAAPAGGSGSQPPPPTGMPTQQGRWGTTADDARAAPGWQAAELTPRSGNGVRTVLIVGAVIAVLAVLVVGAAFIGFVGSFGSIVTTDTFAGDDDWSDDFGETVHGGEIAVGDTIRGSTPLNGTFEVDLVVAAPGEVTVDVRADRDFDAVAEIVDSTGQTLDHNDDRGSSGITRVGGGHDLDPLLALDLEPGTYQVRVRGFARDAGSFEIRTS